MIEVYTDGASQGNPGASGAGIYVLAADKIYERAIPLAHMSNHEAEFHAVLHALEICRDHFSGEILSLRTDSRTVVDAVERNHSKNKDFQPLVEEIGQLKKHFPHVFIKWIPGNQNDHADKLARGAIHQTDSE